MTTISRYQRPTKRRDDPGAVFSSTGLGQTMKIATLALIATTTVAATAVAAMTGAAVAAPGATAEPCPASGTGPPTGAAQQSIASLDGETQPDTLWIDVVPNPGDRGGASRLVGISTASGSELGPVSISSASPIPLSAVVVDAQHNGDHQLIVSDGREAHLYVISGCRIQTVVDQAGAPFAFDLGHRQGNGDGVGCSDLGDGTTSSGCWSSSRAANGPCAEPRSPSTAPPRPSADPTR